MGRLKLHRKTFKPGTYLDQEYWFFYNVAGRQWTVCPKGTHKSMWRVPWEVALKNLGSFGEFRSIQKRFEVKTGECEEGEDYAA